MLRFALCGVCLLVGCVTDTVDIHARPRAERYIDSESDSQLVIELDAVPGAEPRAAVETALVARLSSLLSKPDGITVLHDDALSSRGADHAWTQSELDALAAETFDDDSPTGTVTMHVMWLDGHLATDTDSSITLGVAWSNTHIAMFHDSIESQCATGLLLQEEICRGAQLAIWLHEIGHTIGLVDNGIPLTGVDHRDPDHPAHCNDPECIMYWSFEGQAGLASVRDRILGGGAMHDFDAACLDDVTFVIDH